VKQVEEDPVKSMAAVKVFFTIFAILMTPVIVSAHAVLVSSTPKDNAVIKSSPERIILRFDARIEKRVSKVTLLTYKGEKVKLKIPSGGYTEGRPNELIVPIPKLKPGGYRFEYRVLATDGHLTPGLIRFTISGGKST
jgi:methionine-rich copper-binding protein CopC